jgi:arabinogalactan oligomer/maltooligosaccharide transport system permease protein
VSTVVAPTSETSGRRRGSWLPVVLSALSGTTGFLIKICLLALSNALAVWAAYVLATRHNWLAVGALVAVTVLIDAVYLTPRKGAVPLKFLVPGSLLLACFQLIPILYTVNLAFTNYSTGHVATKAEAIVADKVSSLEQTANGTTYDMAIGQAGGSYALILRDQNTGKFYIGTKDALQPAPAGSVTVSGGAITAAKGYTLLQGIVQINDAENGPLKDFVVPLGHDDAYVGFSGISTAVELKPTLRYDAKKDQFVNLVTGTVYANDGRGNFANTADPKDVLDTGWKTYIGGSNFTAIFKNPAVRSPFLRVFAWTFAFAGGTVFFSFAIGLLLALALDKKGMRFQKVYRSILVIPWAVPGFLSLLVWGGLLNDQFGVINNILGTNIQWLTDPWWARFSCIAVSTWLTVPYFFVVSMGALQSIPEELVEAARVDGASARQIFQRVRLPLLLVAVGPLLIASFAFNFNNFNNIYLLTRGGPTFVGGSGVAGATDILISYTYKVALGSGLGNNFGLASAITIFIFLITAALSAVGFSRTAVLEERV